MFTCSLPAQCSPAVGYCRNVPMNVLGSTMFPEPLHLHEELLPKISLCEATSSR